MARPLYSTRFIAASITTGGNVIYTVPQGFVAVVRSVDALLQNVAGQFVGVILGTAGCYVMYQTASTSGDRTEQWQGRQVVPEGEPIEAFVSGGGTVTVAVSGYLLTV